MNKKTKFQKGSGFIWFFPALLLAIVLFSGCSQPDDTSGVDAQMPNIDSHPNGGVWDVSSIPVFSLTITAGSPDGGNLSYQWYSSASGVNTGGSALLGETGSSLNLAKTDYAGDGTRYFYAVVTNTINDNNDGGIKTASAISNVTEVIVSGNTTITINSETDMARIGNDPAFPLSGTYILANDITLTDWVPVGDELKPFRGAFNGNEKKITLNSFSNTAVFAQTCLGIFGYVRGDSVMAKAAINNLIIDSSVNVTSHSAIGQAVGILTGYAEQAKIENINLLGTFNFSSEKTVYAGGIAGYINRGTLIKNCDSSLTMYISPGRGEPVASGIQPYSYVGGFVGLFMNGAEIVTCRNTGNVTADNKVNAVIGQVFVGGIAGGSFHSFSTNYHGCIQDSSSSGNITGKAKGDWTFIGGIAGTIVGYDTRIERSFATGIVSAEGTNSRWTYIGGIVGYLYYGALVSQSYFDGIVIADKSDNGVDDYTGGIAGYSSQHSSAHSRIEDCWSSGTVTGFKNAGGIVGQNQINTYVRRSYSTAVVSVTGSASTGVGGIAGMNASTMPNGAISGCAALNPSISSPNGNNINRVTGTIGGNRSNNYAWAGMIINPGIGTYTPQKGDSLAGGADIHEQKPAQSFYIGLGWDFDNVWKMGSGGYPILQWQKDQ